MKDNCFCYINNELELALVMMSGTKLKVWYLVYTFASIDFDKAALIFHTEAAQRWNTHWHREQDSEEERCTSLGSHLWWIQNKTLEMVRAVEEWRNWPHREPRNPFVSIYILTTRCASSHHWLQKSMGKDNGFIAGYRFPYNQIFPVFSSISKICSYLTCHFKKWKVFQGFKNFPGDPVA